MAENKRDYYEVLGLQKGAGTDEIKKAGTIFLGHGPGGGFQRDDEARAAFNAELEKDDLNGLYMRDIIREEVKPDDPRLR